MGGDKYVCTLSPELLQRAKDEINEDPDRREADIEHIRDWLRHQPHINARMDDWTILRFLRGCKFSLERTKEKLDMFYTCKSLCPEWYKNRDPQDKKLRSILELGIMLPLPGHDQLGRKVLFGRWGIYDPKMVSMDELIKTTSMFIDVMLDEDELSSITGYVMLGDCTGLTVSHAIGFTPSHAKKSLVMWQVCVLPMGRLGEEREREGEGEASGLRFISLMYRDSHHDSFPRPQRR
ncbi:retinol-binding protein pinta-like isoform X2 [Eriocheir sinensis]|uniref:retinol-binding protein pinta-like isoform X2 n=1 Tax=Eriocheir sinensis TaxID=95602 RepID=UPI0021C67599|nr:retinol-binding protein pinta-like isoform X2 [Eriocheir sinensis]